MLDPGTVENLDDAQADDIGSSQTVLDPSSNGIASRLSTNVAKTHRTFAIALAVVGSFAMLGIFVTGVGLLLTHVFEHGSLGVWDHHVSQWFDRHRTRTWNRITGDATDFADTIEVAAVAAVVTIILLIRRWGRHALLLVAGLVIELSVFLTANQIVARPRPAVSHLGGTPSTFSFPSGHTAATFVLYGGISLLVTVATTRRWPGILAWVLAFAFTTSVALSRVYRGEHYPTDVLAGLMLGIGSLLAGVFIIRVAGVGRGVVGSPRPSSAHGQPARVS